MDLDNFPKWITYLLKYFVIWGFHPEISAHHRKISILFVIHVVLACFLTGSMISFIVHSNLTTESCLNLVNDWIQYVSALIAYWIIILEAYIQRAYQRKFWIVYQNIDLYSFKRLIPNLRNYRLKFLEYFVIFLMIQIRLIGYFITLEQEAFSFLFTYFMVVKMYQSRVFYYIFYLELIKDELISIEKKLKTIVSISDCSVHDVSRNWFKELREYYKSVYEMVNCINEIFGWSQFITILFCFHLPMTDLNWAYSSIHLRSIGYMIGDILLHIYPQPLAT